MRLVGVSLLLLACLSPVSARGAAPAPGEWLAGDLHVHTCYSHDVYCGPSDDNTGPDEFYTAGGDVRERFLEASAKGLDYLAITDHQRVDGIDDPGFGGYGVVGVPGYENSIGGHAQMLGARRIYPHRDNTPAQINAMASALRRDGGLFQANHPADDVGRQLTSCTDLHGMMWPYAYGVKVDSVEVWNTNHYLQTPLPAAAGNDDAIFWWECLLSRGQHVAATGGGDSHWLSVTAVQGVGNPTTWVFSKARTASAVLDGIRAGHTSISLEPPSEGGLRLLLEADRNRDGVYESMMGDTVPPGTPVRVRAVGQPGSGLVRVRANGKDLVSDAVLTPGGHVDLVAPRQRGWLWASLYAPDAQQVRQQYCDGVIGAKSTYCRYEIGMLAMTSALYLR